MMSSSVQDGAVSFQSHISKLFNDISRALSFSTQVLRSIFIVSKVLTMRKIITALLSTVVLSYLLAAGYNDAKATCSASQRATTIPGCLSLAKSGNAQAQFDMSTRYFTGTEGVKRDVVLAYMWAKVCAQKEQVTCGKLINILEMNMSKIDIAAAKEMASKCLQSNLMECD